jgi:hypothetical protein
MSFDVGVELKNRAKMTTNNLSALGKASKNAAIRARQQKEADDFNAMGLTIQDLVLESQLTTNPVLRRKILGLIADWKNRSKKSRGQNEMNLAKLDEFKKDALGLGLRKVQKALKDYISTNDDYDAEIFSLLLALEFANIEAKRHEGVVKTKIYERKTILLEQLEPMLYDCGWKYGVSYASGKNADYLIFVYLPNGEQLSWHCNEFEVAREYPYIEAEWDGQICSTMGKILDYICDKYSIGSHRNKETAA